MPRRKIHHEGEMCVECGENPKRRTGHTLADGTPRYSSVCNRCHKIRYLRPWMAFTKDSCEMCGYTPMFKGSLDVHHRDGDKSNNDPDNYMTVCASCHRELEHLIRETGDYEMAESLFARFIKALIS